MTGDWAFAVKDLLFTFSSHFFTKELQSWDCGHTSKAILDNFFLRLVYNYYYGVFFKDHVLLRTSIKS